MMIGGQGVQEKKTPRQPAHKPVYEMVKFF
jgi:hypothetical protein